MTVEFDAGGEHVARVEGTGLLARTVREVLDDTCPPDAPHPAGPRLVCAVSDSWAARDDAERRRCRHDGTTRLPVHTELSTVVVGPVEGSGWQGCQRCADSRRHRAERDREGYAAVRARHAAELEQRPASLLTPLAATAVAAIVGAEARRVVSAQRPRCAAALLMVRLTTLEVTKHDFLPDPNCPDCAAPPDEDTSPPQLTSRPKPAPDCYRANPSPDPDELTRRYLDPEVGLIRELRSGRRGGLVVAAARMGLRPMPGAPESESGYGRTPDYRSSVVTALCEALERYGGLQQGRDPTTVRARFVDIRAEAIDVPAIGFPPEESYALPEAPYHPFDPEREYSWVTGYSFARQAAVLVPECLAYYGARARRDHPFVQETSNGAALGGCLEEAILHGLLEVAERDALLMTWHRRTPRRAIDPASARDPAIRLLVSEIEQRFGYRVWIFDTTMEHGLPSVWALAVRGDADPSRPVTATGAAAHPLPERAAVNALAELSPFLSDLVETYPGERDRAAALAADPTLVTRMRDHALRYAHEDTLGRFDFLRSSPELTTFDALPPLGGSADLRTDLEELVDRFLSQGLDVVVVDQTSSEHRAGGFHCVKVLVPGTTPMSFGHQNRRLSGLRRLRDGPGAAGPSGSRRTRKPNTDPHPFP
ncbi:TOMM precursor leader peptide-binding protein [Halostreptopolyspora alba]|uniref:YcaO domain-containing protein n=1 Tax=Halostreptopolyspora alba TaxID=2487137 RepID=A0A3N0EEA3_9ACTN|nr:hypothetical protein EFW17_05565 [Nocardiopsaceae bacterium YIM 96095]